jgi:hypothetical protein
MTLTFYNVSDDPRTVKKTLGTAVATISNVFAKEPLDFMSPTFILSGVNSNSGFNNRNYLFCQELNRYYFIKDYINVPGDLTEVICTEDVLMTYADKIMNSDCVVFNQSRFDKGNSLIPDSRLPMQANTESRTFAFQPGELSAVSVSDYSFVLNVFGGSN